MRVPSSGRVVEERPAPTSIISAGGGVLPSPSVGKTLSPAGLALVAITMSKVGLTDVIHQASPVYLLQARHKWQDDQLKQL